MFGQLLTDHMLEIDWTINDGWDAPKIVPVAPLMLSPANSTLHYALQCFEGLKGYPHYNGSAINIFRAIENMKRFKISFESLAFPSFKEDELLKCIIDLVKLERDWMPKKP